MGSTSRGTQDRCEPGQVGHGQRTGGFLVSQRLDRPADQHDLTPGEKSFAVVLRQTSEHSCDHLRGHGRTDQLLELAGVLLERGRGNAMLRLKLKPLADLLQRPATRWTKQNGRVELSTDKNGERPVDPGSGENVPGGPGTFGKRALLQHGCTRGPFAPARAVIRSMGHGRCVNLRRLGRTTNPFSLKGHDFDSGAIISHSWGSARFTRVLFRQIPPCSRTRRGRPASDRHPQNKAGAPRAAPQAGRRRQKNGNSGASCVSNGERPSGDSTADRETGIKGAKRRPGHVYQGAKPRTSKGD